MSDGVGVRTTRGHASAPGRPAVPAVTSDAHLAGRVGRPGGGWSARRRVGAVLVSVCIIAGCDDPETNGSRSAPPTTSPSPPSTSHGDGPAASPPLTSQAAERLDLDAIVTTALGDHDGGITALVVHDGGAVTAAAGVKSSDGAPMTADTPSRVGSISKSFIATMVLQLVDEGRVDLDERLATYMPATPVGADVTVRQLLGHHSGLPDYTHVTAYVPDVLADRARRFEPEDLLRYVADVRVASPGGRFAYSNTNYILLGQLIERLDGVELNTALDTRITGPLDLPSTRFAIAGTSEVEGLAAGWSPGFSEGDPESPYDSIASSAWSAGALVSTTTELAAFLRALFAGDLVSDESLAAMTDTGTSGYGLGLELNRFAADQRGYGHHGAIPGYLSVMAIDPSNGDTIVVLTNSETVDPESVFWHIRNTW